MIHKLLFVAIFTVFLTTLPLYDAKRGGSSHRSSGRSSSASRGNHQAASGHPSGGHHYQPAGSHHNGPFPGSPPSGGFHSPGSHNRPLSGSPSGGFQQPSYGRSVGTASNGGVLQGHTSQLVMAGLAGGLAGAALGAGTYGLISAANSRYTSPENGRTYYLGEKNYPGKPPSDHFLCKYTLNENNTMLGDLYDENNSTKVKEIFYECKINEETCCKGLDCCKKPQVIYIKKDQDKPVDTPWWSVVLIALLSVSLMSCVGYFVYLNLKKHDNDIRNDHQFETTYDIYQTTTNDQLQQPYHQTGGQQQGYGHYPSGPAGNMGYPASIPNSSGGNYYQQTPFYPAQQQQHNYPAVAPSNNTQTYGFNVPQPYPSVPQ